MLVRGMWGRMGGIRRYRRVVRDAKQLPTTRITVAGWIRVAKHKSFNRIASHEWVHWGWNLYTDASGVARFGVGQDNKDFAAGRMIFRNRWHFVCGTYDGRGASIAHHTESRFLKTRQSCRSSP